MKKRIASLFLTFVIVFETGTSAFAARTDIAASLNAAIPLAEIIPATDSGKNPVGTSAPALVSVAVTSLPDKLDYLCADSAVDPAGGVLSLVYSDGTEVETELTEAQLSALDGTVGEVSVSITREGFTTGFSVNAPAVSTRATSLKMRRSPFSMPAKTAAIQTETASPPRMMPCCLRRTFAVLSARMRKTVSAVILTAIIH